MGVQALVLTLGQLRFRDRFGLDLVEIDFVVAVDQECIFVIVIILMIESRGVLGPASVVGPRLKTRRRTPGDSRSARFRVIGSFIVGDGLNTRRRGRSIEPVWFRQEVHPVVRREAKERKGFSLLSEKSAQMIWQIKEKSKRRREKRERDMRRAENSELTVTSRGGSFRWSNP